MKGRADAVMSGLAISVACEDFSYYVGPEPLLQRVNFLVEPGELLAVVGAAGAGKSLLLSCIAFRKKAGLRKGHVLLNGRPAEAREMRSACNFVVKDGRMLPYLTVFETLQTAAALKLPDLPEKSRLQRVERVLGQLNLVQCRNTYVGGEWRKGISTGEKKRLSVAMELLDDPSVLLLDDPTSGLDSSLAYQLMALLRKLAVEQRRTVICSVQQPSSQLWNQFDLVLLLTRGSVAFYGKASEAKAYFARHGFECPKSYNPADFFLELVSSNGGFRRTTFFCSSRAKSDGAKSAESESEEGGEHEDLEIISRRSHRRAKRLLALGGAAQFLTLYEASDECKELRRRLAKAREEEEKEASPPTVGLTADERGNSKKDNPTKDVGGASAPVLLFKAKKGVITDTNNDYDYAASTSSVVSRWCKQVGTLAKRSFKNSIRNPVACCIVLLVQALQGIVLGGIFWQLTSHVNNAETSLLEPKLLLQNPWMQMFVNGIGGGGHERVGINESPNQPLLDAITDGVDGNLSQPFAALLNDTASLSWLGEVLSCAIPVLRPYTYPDFGLTYNYDDDDNDDDDDNGGVSAGGVSAGGVSESNSIESNPRGPGTAAAMMMQDSFFSPEAIAPKFVALLQLLDWSYLKNQWWTPQLEQSSISYWLNITEAIKDDLLNPFMVCAGYPAFFIPNWEIATNRERTATTSSSSVYLSAAGRAAAAGRADTTTSFDNRPAGGVLGGKAGPAPSRGLLIFDEGQIANVVEDLGAAELLATSQHIIQRIETCQNAACVWIGSKYRSIVEMQTRIKGSVLAIINVLGALFFVVAGLGFASYDALLTFPQERILFNRESASGLYKASSYFVAKNLADIPFQLIPSFILVTIYYFFSGIGGTVLQYVTYIAVCSCVTFAAYGFGYMVSAASPRMEIAVLVAPVILVLWLTLAGFFLRDEQIPKWVGWFGCLSFYRWGFFSLVANQFPQDGTFGVLPNRVPLAMAGATDTRVWFMTSCLLCLGISYRLLALLALKYTNRSVGLQL